MRGRAGERGLVELHLENNMLEHFLVLPENVRKAQSSGPPCFPWISSIRIWVWIIIRRVRVSPWRMRHI